MNERKLPPVTQVGMASLALIVAGGIYLSAHLPQHVPLGVLMLKPFPMDQLVEMVGHLLTARAEADGMRQSA